MYNLYNISAAPHIKDNSTTRSIMLDVCIAMIPCIGFGIYQFGFNAFLVIITSVVACILSEYLYQRLMKKNITIYDCSAVVTGLILALNLPANIPLWQVIIGAFFAIIVVKQVYGGIGQNWMNPALGARCFLLISFAKSMTDFTSKKLDFDSLSSVTPLAAIKNGTFFTGYDFNIFDLFIGTIPGTIGEVSALALLIGAIYLLIKKVIKLRIPLTYILTVAIFVFIFGKHDFIYVLAHIFSGGLIFGAFFMATDYSSSPLTVKGQYIFAIFIGLLTGIFRLFTGSAEGVSYAIIIGNILSPLIEKYTFPKVFGMRGKKYEKITY